MERSSAGKISRNGTCPIEFESSTRHECSHFAGNSRNLIGAILLGDAIVDSELLLVTSSIISRI